MSWSEVKEEIIASVTIASLAGSRSTRIACPFHHSEAQDMQLFHEDNRWKCWGKCQTSGDIFDWYMLENGVDFKTAMKSLAEYAGISLSPSKERTETLVQAQQFYHQQLADYPEAITYLKKRGFSEEWMFRKQIGYAADRCWPDNVPIRRLEQVGLIKPSQYGPWPWFRGHIVYPIYDKHCNQVQMQGRAFPYDDNGPKYLALGQDVELQGRPIYQCLAGEEILRDKFVDWVFLVEGWPDRETLAAWGLNALGIFGNKGLEKHSHKLKHLNRIYVLLDPDKASQGKLLDQLYLLAMRAPHVDIRNIVMPVPEDVDLNDWARQGRTPDQPLDPDRDADKIAELRGWCNTARPLIEDLITHWVHEPWRIEMIVRLIARSPDPDRWVSRLAQELGEAEASVRLLLRVLAPPTT